MNILQEPSIFDEKRSYYGEVPVEWDLSVLPPEALVDIAMERLSAAGVQLIEWRALLYRRLNVPIITKNFSYIIPDSSISLASSTLSEMGLPESAPPPFLVRTEGDLYSKATLHRLTDSVNFASVRYIALYPSSYISYLPSELEETLSMTHVGCTGYPALPVRILIPRPAALYASLLRLIVKSPKGRRPTRTILESDLSLLIRYHLYQMDPYHKYDDDDDSEDEDQDIIEAVALVQQWTLEKEWREGEEWIGHELSAIVSGTKGVESLLLRPMDNSACY
ncbi:hypothetical protein BDZ94DRAFT_1157418 [Collybia nuda]|uniref:Uncharacterized protein n=1 Tax=Collybia nuda TaxID=64659 RepID=A0A9P5YAV3_9AGAR|nr:hypothetical protein BDZ94DRAFT_1157418 [Collybia nuda]